MFATLDLTWQPSGAHPTPPAGRAPAIVRNDTYAHRFRITGGWAALGSASFAAQLRRVRLKGASAGAPLAAFTVTPSQDTDDLLIDIALTSAQTTSLIEDMEWDLQVVIDDSVTTLLSGKAKVLNDVTRV